MKSYIIYTPDTSVSIPSDTIKGSLNRFIIDAAPCNPQIIAIIDVAYVEKLRGLLGGNESHDWNKLRDMFFKEHTISIHKLTGIKAGLKRSGTIKQISTAPHDLFEWFKNEFDHTQPPDDFTVCDDCALYFVSPDQVREQCTEVMSGRMTAEYFDECSKGNCDECEFNSH